MCKNRVIYVFLGASWVLIIMTRRCNNYTLTYIMTTSTVKTC